jgi:hypothetical protein
MLLRSLGRDFKAQHPAVRLFIVALVLVSIWLGIHSVVLFAEGNRNPSLPSSAPCSVLNASMLPDKYLVKGRWGWHFTVRAESTGIPISKDVVVENRCFNGGTGSSFLWVDGELAAFSRIDRNIYDCHGQRLWKTDYDFFNNKLKVCDANGNQIWASQVPDYQTQLSIYSQPDNVVVATVSKSGEVIIQQSSSPAADPRLVVML